MAKRDEEEFRTLLEGRRRFGTLKTATLFDDHTDECVVKLASILVNSRAAQGCSLASLSEAVADLIRRRKEAGLGSADEPS
jgi:hypothetical protein